MRYQTTAFALVAVFAMVGCLDRGTPTDVSPDEVTLSPEHSPLMQSHQNQNQPRLNGRTVQNLDVTGLLEEGLGDPASFTGRIANLNFERVGDEILASGRLIGRLTNLEDGTTQRINEVFENVAVTLLDGLGGVIVPNGNGNGVCPILFLELGPIFLDVLGLIVEVPDPIIVEIRAERGPGQLLGNLLCALLGILD